jgi:Rps23 Pro-64 3,4-dihydroxylase Tpa1-like proline 4-hydroxylase
MIDPIFYTYANRIKQLYEQEQPFPNQVFEHFLDPTILALLEEEASKITEDEWERGLDIGIKDGQEFDEHQWQTGKRGIRRIENMPPIMSAVCKYFNSDKFMDWVKIVTGIEDLEPDPQYRGGGYHETIPGGYLDVHKDFTYHEGITNTPFRKVNLLIYLNPVWEEEYGGYLELWDNELTKCHHKIKPISNTAVLFNTDNAPHGHPDPVSMNRRSLAFYYYDNTETLPRTERAHWRGPDI